MYEAPPVRRITSAVWLTTTSRITFIPSRCAHSTKAELFYSAYPENTRNDVLKAIAVRDKFVDLLNTLQ